MGGWEVLLESLLLVFALAMFVGKLFEELVVRIGLPPVLGDLIAGLILGSSFLAVYPVNDFIIAFSWLGIAFLLLYAGLETRYREFMRSIGLYGFITIGEGLAAFGMGFLVGAFFGYPIRSAYFIGAVLVATSISVSVRTLIDLKKLATPEGYAVLGVAVLDDLMALIVIVVGISLIKTGTFNIVEIARVVSTTLIYWLAIVYFLHKLANTITRGTLRFKTAEALTAIVLGLSALFMYLTKYLQLSPLVAAYATGLALSEAHGIKKAIERIRPLALLFSIIFFMTSAAELDIWSALQPKYIVFYIVIVAAAFIGKILGGGLTSLIIGFPPISAIRIAIGLFPRAEFCIIAAYTGYSAGLFGAEIYLSALLIVLFTNLLTPIFLKIVFTRGPEVTEVRFRWRRKRF